MFTLIYSKYKLIKYKGDEGQLELLPKDVREKMTLFVIVS